MAEHGIEVKVDVSSCMHDALMDFAQYMFDEYGVKVSSVNFNWVATGTVITHRCRTSTSCTLPPTCTKPLRLVRHGFAKLRNASNPM